MRILIVDTWYPRVLERVYAESPGLAEGSYEEQWETLMATAFGTADAYSHYLREAGHEAHELIVNCEPLQRAWERENGPRRGRGPLAWLRPGDGQAALVESQADAFRPDVVYVQNLSVLPARSLRRLRHAGRLLVGQLGIEPPDRDRLHAFDLIVTSLPHFVQRLNALDVHAEYLRIGFDPRVLSRLRPKSPDPDRAVFVGSVSRIQHSGGSELLAHAAEQAPLAVWGVGIEEWPEASALRRSYRGEAWGLEMYELLAGAPLAINRHADFADGYANNMRLYEVTGVGTLLLTDSKENLQELFDVGREVVAYTSADDLADKIRYYLSHESERNEIAAAGQRRTMTEHTYGSRMQELSEILERRLASRGS